jgi:DHA1 family multidrug resistance protein-like MFS transporter
MVYQLVRDSFAGRLLYHLSGHKWFNYPEEQPGYRVPGKYLSSPRHSLEKKTCSLSRTFSRSDLDKCPGPVLQSLSEVDLERSPAIPLNDTLEGNNEEVVYVDWDGSDDPENPHNWPLWQKVVFCSEIGILTLSVYMGSAIYTPGEDGLMADMGTGQVGATLGLSMFVFGYGTGPMILSPMSEHPVLGRTYIYIITLFVFVVLQIPTALSTSLPEFLILRYVAGFFASPALATGGASLGDVVPKAHMPIGLGIWGVCAVCGPFLGPLIGAALVDAKSWRWAFYYLAIQGAAALVCLTFFLPETSQGTLLHRKAKRLRALTGNSRIVAKEAYETGQIPFKQVVIEILWRPIQVSFLEPMILAINSHLALLYAIIYLWFESFPIVFQGIYHFSNIEMGVSYIALMLGAWLGAAIYVAYSYRRYTIPVLNHDPVEPEVFLPANLAAATTLPIGLFIFGWTATEDIHWIVPLFGAFLFAPGMFMLFQTHFNYLGDAFPKYMASVFAGNDLFRSCVGAAFPIIANTMYNNTGSKKFPVGWGCSIMAFICTAMISIPILFLWKGKTLRLMSKRAI